MAGDSYHDVEVQIGKKRFLVADDYSLELTMTRVRGWSLWRLPTGRRDEAVLIGEEFGDKRFRIRIRGEVVFDTRRRRRARKGRRCKP